MSPLIILVAAIMTGAAGAPSVSESTGDLSYTYDFALPQARGRHQPSLALAYTSSARTDVGLGFGWSIAQSYIEIDTTRTPAANANVQYRLVRSGKAKPLVQVSASPLTFRQDVEGEYLNITFTPNIACGAFEARDAWNNTYVFGPVALPWCGRWYLKQVIDGLGNETTYEYASEVTDPNIPTTTGRLTAIRWNKVNGTNVHSVELTWDASPALQPSWEAAGGFMTDHRQRLTTVTVKGLGATVRSYLLGYGASATGKQALLTSVTERGTDGSAQPATVFDYGQASATGWSLDDATASLPHIDLSGVRPPPCGESNCTAAGGGAWQDLDGDSRPDLVWGADTGGHTKLGIYWARNTTPIGSSTLSFDPARLIPNSSTVWDGTSQTNSPFRDFDGDGTLDRVLVTVIKSDTPPAHPCPASTSSTTGRDRGWIYIWFGRMGASGAYEFASQVATCVDITPQVKDQTVGDPNAPTIAEVNGDGVLDVVKWNCEVSPCRYKYWLGSVALVGMNKVPSFSAVGWTYFVPGQQFPRAPPTCTDHNGYSTLASDMNGDGVADAVDVVNSTWQAALMSGSASQSSPTQWGVGPSLDDHPTVNPEPLCYWEVDEGGYYPEPSTAAVPDRSISFGATADLNGDGRTDGLVWRGGQLKIRWNDGRAFRAAAADTLVPFPLRNGTSVTLYPDMRRWRQTSTIDCSQGCRYAVPSRGNRGIVMDANGDGVADYVYVDYSVTPTQWWFFRGALKTSGSPIDGGREILLRTVTTPFGARHQVEYAPATKFGANSPRPVVVALTTRGMAAAASIPSVKTKYWYSEATRRSVWYDPSRMEDGGFAQSWSQDDVTRIIAYKRFAAGSYAISESPDYEAWGTETTAGSETTPPGMSSFKIATTIFATKQVAFPTNYCTATTNPAASEYPVRVIATSTTGSELVGSIWSAVQNVVACADVDMYGNTTKAAVTPSLNGIAGRTAVSRQYRTGNTACAAVPGTLEKLALDGAITLTREVEKYDNQCRLIEKYAGLDAAKTNRTTNTYLGCQGSLDSSTSGGVAKRLQYDANCLQVTAETTEDAIQSLPGSVSLVTLSTWDVGRGLKLSETGPVVAKRSNATYSGLASTGISRFWSYDTFGRIVAVSKAAPSGGGVTRAVEATTYQDSPSSGPRSVTQYSFAVEKSFTLGVPPTTNDVKIVQTFIDELGREIQSKERLGGGGAADPAAQVTQSVTGYLVSGVKVLDGAGRPLVVLEPFYDSGPAWMDYGGASLRPPQNGVSGMRGTQSVYDPRGRQICAITRWIPSTADLRTQYVGACTSSSAQNANFRQSVEMRFGVRYESGRGPYGGYLVATEVIAPDQNEGAAPSAMPLAGLVTGRTVKLSGPVGEELGTIDGDGNFVWIERDVLGREIASWRESWDRSGSAKLSTRRPADGAWGGTRSTTAPQAASWIIYNVAGQAYQSWDANSAVLRTNTYDEAGRLTFTSVNAAGDGMQYVYGAGSLGRITQVTEKVGAVYRNIATNLYDTPYVESDSGYAYTAGKLSWTGNAETEIGYGYDDAGRTTRRDQWFARVNAAAGTSRYGMGTTYGADGRVRRADHVKPGGTNQHAQFVYYDSAGRPVKLTGQRDAGPITTYWEAANPSGATQGAYDPLGRIPSLKADSGLVTSARQYDAYSGLLTQEHKLIQAATKIYDTTGAQYRGAKLASFQDTGSATLYSFVYWPSGRLNTAKATPTPSTVPGPLTQDYDHQFTFNGVGNVATAIEKQNLTAESAAVGRVRKQYDRESRYVKPDAAKPTEVTDQLSELVTTRSTNNIQDCSSSATYTYDTLGRLVARGADTCTGRSAETFTYDLDGHLLGVTRAGVIEEKLGYGPSGELVWRQVGTKITFYASEYASVTAQVDGLGAVIAGTLKTDEHVVLAGTRIASTNGSRILYYYRTRLGTVVGTSLDGGRLGVRYRYGPYGEPTTEVLAGAIDPEDQRSEFGYTNAVTLTGGLIYLKARVYDTVSRTFLQADSVDRLRYAYVWGDPANLNDPTGLLPATTVVKPSNEAASSAGYSVQADPASLSAAGGQTDSPDAQSQAARESLEHGENRVALQAEERAVDRLSAKAATVAQKMAAVSVDEKRNGLTRAGAAVVGAVAGLLDKDHIETTAAVVAGGTLAVIAAPLVVSAAAGGSAAAATGTAAGTTVVYRSLDAAGKVQYVGITNDLARRAAEHLAGRGIAIEPVVEGLSRSAARGVEQALINVHGLASQGGTLLNKINGIAMSNPIYQNAVTEGKAILEKIGY